MRLELAQIEESGGGVAFYDLSHHQESFGEALARGLSGRPKSIPARFLYDAQGSALFERICTLPEYYLTRCETEILRHYATDMARLMGPEVALIELGSGSSLKVRILLDAMERPAAYVPIDVSGEHLLAAAGALARDYPQVSVAAICADYGEAFPLPQIAGAGRHVAFFPGSTIGNLEPDEAEAFLGMWAGRQVDMLVGVDLVKSAAILEPAYEDAEGVTAAFSLNLLARANRELGADFRLDRFAHRSRWNPQASRIEIHLESLVDQDVTVAGARYAFAAGEPIETEHSYKYTIADFQALGRRAGYAADVVWTDPKSLFSLHYLTSGPGRP